MSGGVGGLFLMVRRSMRQHALSTAVTLFSAALAGGLALSVFSIQRQASNAFTGGPVGFDAVLGARGSKLQLVLNTVFHLETSPGNIPWKMYTELKQNPLVELAIPYAVGDNFRGFRIVGTSNEMFTRFEYQKDKKFEAEPGGRFFEPTRREAVIGSFAAQKTGIKVGDTINPYHGLEFHEADMHKDEYIVVGILKPTNSPSDRVVWIPIEGIFRMSGHKLRGSGEEYTARSNESIPDEHKEVSAVMLKFKNPQAGMALDQTINKQGKVATLAWPIGQTMAELFQKLGWMNRVLALVAYLVVVVVAASILASIYNTINERRREFAILRALGARRSFVFSLIITEAATISFIGALLGFFVYAAILVVTASIVRGQTGVVLSVGSFHPALIGVPMGMAFIGALAGIIPAIKAYSTDVSSNLTPNS